MDVDVELDGIDVCANYGSTYTGVSAYGSPPVPTQSAASEGTSEVDVRVREPSLLCV